MLVLKKKKRHMASYRVSIICCLLTWNSLLPAADAISVVVSILPQQYFVEQIGGKYIDARLMVGPGQSPATYEPTPRQIAEIENSQLYLSIGVPFERAWLSTIRRNNPGLRVVDNAALIESRGSEHQAEYDAHLWVSPKNAIRMTQLIRRELIALDKRHEDEFTEAADRLIKQLRSLDKEIEIALGQLVKRELIVSHPSWTVFAQQYNLNQHSIEQHGKEIQAASISELIEFAKSKRIKAVFSQPQFNNRAAEIIASEIGATVILLDPLAYHYINNMRKVTAAIVAGLSR